MAKRSKKKQKTAQLMAISALTVSTIAPYAVSASEEVPVSNDVNLVENTEAVNQTVETLEPNNNQDLQPSNEFEQATSNDVAEENGTTVLNNEKNEQLNSTENNEQQNDVTTGNENVVTTETGILKPGNYKMSFSAESKAKGNVAQAFTLYSGDSKKLGDYIDPEIVVDEAGNQLVTFYVNRDVSTKGFYDFKFMQGEQELETKILAVSKSDTGKETVETIQVKVPNFKEPITTKYKRNTTEYEFDLTFDSSSLTNLDKPRFVNAKTIEDGIYEVDMSYFITDTSTYTLVVPEKINNWVLPKATLEIVDGKYFVTATFKGLNEGNPEKNLIVNTISINSNDNVKVISQDYKTQETVITFEVQDPFYYNNISPTNWLYEAKEPRQGSSKQFKIHINPHTMKRIGDAQYKIANGHYSAPISLKEFATETNNNTYNSVFVKKVAIDIEDEKTYVTIPVLQHEEAIYKIDNITSDLPMEQLKDEEGNLYALKFEVPNIDSIIPFSFTSVNKETEDKADVSLYIAYDDLVLEKLEQPLTFSYDPVETFDQQLEDGVYSVDVKAFTGTTITSIDTAKISSDLAFENMKLTVKDGKKTLSGTVKNKSSWLYPKNFKIEKKYGSFQFKDVSLLKEIDVENEIYNQDISMEVEQIGVPQRIIYETYKMDNNSMWGKSSERIYIDPTSIKPYVDAVDEFESISYQLSAAGTGEMDEFIANYLNPYFEKPAKIKEENDIQYAYITLTGKMYIAEDIRYVAEDGTEKKVEVVEDNGKTGMERERVVKFPVHSPAMKMYVDGESFGQYYFNLDFNLKQQVPYKVSYAPNQPEAPIDIAAYLNPYFEKPATVYKENGQYFAEITFNGKMYGAQVLQAVKTNGEKVDAQIVADNGKEGMERVFTAKFPLENDVLDIFIKTGSYGEYTLRLNFDEKVENTQPSEQVEEKEAPIPTLDKLEENKDIPLNFKFDKPDGEQQITLQVALQAVLKNASAKKVIVEGKPKLRVEIPLDNFKGYSKLKMIQNGKVVAEWTNNSQSTVASLNLIRVATASSQLVANVDSLEGITFEAYEKIEDSEPIKAEVASVTTDVKIIENNPETGTEPGENNGGSTGGGTTTPGGSAVGSDYDNSGEVTVEKSISHSFTAKEIEASKYGSMGDGFIANYLAPYFNNAQLVTVNGTKYIQITLTGKAYGIESFSGGQFVSSSGTGMNQVRVVRVPAANTGTYLINAGEYGVHDLTFTFGVTDADLDGSTTNPSESKPEETKSEVVDVESTGDAEVKLAVTENNKEITKFVSKFDTIFKDGKYSVKLALANTTNVKQFIVKQDGKEIARWNNSNTTAKIASLFGAKIAATANELTFEVESLDGITLEAVTTEGSLTAAIQATSKVELEKPTPVEGEISYTMQADPTDSMSEFITNYLAPYFTKVQEVEVDGKQYIEMTLVGKAYGFESIQYEDAKGKLQDVVTVSRTGEKLEQVRVIRIPLIKDKDGVTKVRVDSGDLGYGAYTLFFTFDVDVKNNIENPDGSDEETDVTTPSEEETQAPTEEKSNPFKDIANSSYATDILALYKAGITTGTTDTTFSPTKNMTRAQFAVMIARALALTTTKETQFKDVKGKWYASEVQALADAGIVTGADAKTFNPNKAITRQQAAAIIYRMLAYKGYKATAKASDLNYKDANKIADYAKQPLAELQAKGIMTGDNGYIKGSQKLTRGQMAKVLKRALDELNYKF